MKKLVAFLITILLIFTTNINAFAVVNEPSENTTSEIMYFDDGSYIETTLTIEESNISTFATNTISGSRKMIYKNSDGEAQWTAILKGTFTYTGSSATCTASSISYTIENSKWKISSATASRSGNKATGNIIAKRYTFGIPVQTVEAPIAITCSATGVLS